MVAESNIRMSSIFAEPSVGLLSLAAESSITTHNLQSVASFVDR